MSDTRKNLNAVDQIARGLAALGQRIYGRAPGIIRSPQQIFAEGLDVKKDFGAIGDNSADDTNAMLAAIADAAPNGFRLGVPYGRYKITQPLVATVSPFDPSTASRGFALIGHAGNQSVIAFDGSLSADIIKLIGSSGGGDCVNVSNLAIVRPGTAYSTGATGAALRLENFHQGFVREIYSTGNGHGLYIIGSNGIEVDGLISRFDLIGVELINGYSTGSNVCALKRMSVLSSHTCGIKVSNSVGLTLNAVNIEGTGTTRDDDDFVKALEIYQPGADGGLAIDAIGLYIENIRGYGIYCTPTEYACTWRFGGTVNRASTQGLEAVVFNANALGAASAEQTLDIRALTMRSTTTPNVNRRLVSFPRIGGYIGLTFLDDGTRYPNAVERPDIPVQYRHIGTPQNARVSCLFAGVGGDPIASHGNGVVTSVKTDTGVYQITMDRPPVVDGNIKFLPESINPQNDNGTGSFVYPGGNVITVTIKNAAGSPTDLSFSFTGSWRE